MRLTIKLLVAERSSLQIKYFNLLEFYFTNRQRDRDRGELLLALVSSNSPRKLPRVLRTESHLAVAINMMQWFFDC